MRFIKDCGFGMSARQAIHDAFDPCIRSIDIRDAINSFGVQHTAKGSDNCTMDHCDKGKIQQVVYALKLSDPAAWAWAMYAHAPEGVENVKLLRNALFEYVMKGVSNDSFNAFLSAEAGRMAYIAIYDAAIESRRGDGTRYKRGWQEMSYEIRCSPDDYEKKWRFIFYKMKDLLKDLDGRCLPPVAHVIGLIGDKARDEPFATVDLAEMLKTPEAAA